MFDLYFSLSFSLPIFCLYTLFQSLFLLFEFMKFGSIKRFAIFAFANMLKNEKGIKFIHAEVTLYPIICKYFLKVFSVFVQNFCIWKFLWFLMSFSFKCLSSFLCLLFLRLRLRKRSILHNAFCIVLLNCCCCCCFQFRWNCLYCPIFEKVKLSYCSM